MHKLNSWPQCHDLFYGKNEKNFLQSFFPLSGGNVPGKFFHQIFSVKKLSIRISLFRFGSNKYYIRRSDNPLNFSTSWNIYLSWNVVKIRRKLIWDNSEIGE